MKIRHSLSLCVITLCIAAVSPAGDKPKNLKVLPDTIDGERLTEIMKGFTAALGVRCSFCHVGEEHQPLSEYDFASDDRHGKNVARGMMRMTASVNASIAEIFRGGTGTPAAVECGTCHRGVPVPKRIDEVLRDEMQKGGVGGAMSWFRDARKKYYGGMAYDFSERTLIQFARRLEQEKRTGDAVTVMETNREYFADSPPTLTYLASLYIDVQQPDKAKPLIDTVLMKEPGHERAQRLRERLQRK